MASAEKTLFVIGNFFKILLFILKRKFFFHCVPFICRLFKSAKSPNFSTLISRIFVQTGNFDSYDVIMT